MIPQRALPDVLLAERGLTRLDAGLANTAHARRYACDAARRSALALAQLDGSLVTMGDLLLALVSPAEVELPQRSAAAAAAATYRLLLALHDGLWPAAETWDEAPKDGRLRAETAAAWSSLAAETRRLLAEAEATLHAGEDGADGEGASAPVKLLTPWTLLWVEEIHARWYEAHHIRRPAPWSEPARETVHSVLHLVEEALDADPGIAGAARALHRLHNAPEPESTARPSTGNKAEDEQNCEIRRYIANRTGGGWWPQFTRIVAPWLFARACHLDRLCLPIAAYWRRNQTGYRIALGGSEDDWITWMVRLVSQAAESEAQRSDLIEARHAQWIAATAVVLRLPKRRSNTLGPTRRQRTGTRRSTGRLPRLIELLWEQPMVSTRAVERRLGMTYRSALDLIQDLEQAGILRRVTERKLDRLWWASTV